MPPVQQHQAPPWGDPRGNQQPAVRPLVPPQHVPPQQTQSGWPHQAQHASNPYSQPSSGAKLSPQGGYQQSNPYGHQAAPYGSRMPPSNNPVPGIYGQPQQHQRPGMMPLQSPTQRPGVPPAPGSQMLSPPIRGQTPYSGDPQHAVSPQQPPQGIPGVTSGMPPGAAYGPQQQKQPYGMPSQQQPQQPGPYGAWGGAGSPMTGAPSQQIISPAQEQLIADLRARGPPIPFARPSVHKVPGNNTVKSKAALPLGVVFQPFAASPEVPVVNTGQCKVIRCVKCRSYMNPFVKWTSNGHRWTCNFCATDNETNSLYYCTLDANGQRQDTSSRPELLTGCVEFVASPDYMNRPPMAPAYLVLLDVSMSAVQSGFSAAMCAALKDTIESNRVPGLSRATFGIITFDSNVHFYAIQGNQSTPHLSVVPAGQDVFLPTPDGIMAEIKERKQEILNLLEFLPTYWREQDCQEVNVNAALQAAKMALRMTGGKIIFAVSSLPMAPELGLNPQHEFKDVRGRPVTGRLPDEVDGLKPSSTFFSTFGHNLAQLQIGIDVIVAPPTQASMDLASISQLARHNGGDLMYYPNFRPQTWGDKLKAELAKRLTCKTGWEGVMRVRMSKGWSIKSYSGNYCFRGVDLMMLPHFTEDNTITIVIDGTESVAPEPVCYLQLALLYTTSEGERRIRVITLGLPTTLRLPELAAAIDVEVMTAVMTAKAMDESIRGKLADGRSSIQAQAASVAAILGLSCLPTPPPADTQYPLDETNGLQMLCLYAAGMMKCAAFREGKDVTADHRVYYWHRLRGHSVSTVLRFYCPLLLDITSLPQGVGQPTDTGRIQLPPPRRLSTRVLHGEGAYLCCDGESLLIWVARGVNPEWIRQVFGVQSFDQLLPEYSEISFGKLATPLGSAVGRIIEELRCMYPSNYMKVVVCKAGEPMEFRFIQLLIEDKAHAIGASFLDIWQKFATGTRQMAGMPGSQANVGYTPVSNIYR